MVENEYHPFLHECQLKNLIPGTGTGNPGSATSLLALALALLSTQNIAQRHPLEIVANINPRLGRILHCYGSIPRHLVNNLPRNSHNITNNQIKINH